MIRKCQDNELGTIYSIISDAAQAYQGVIPSDCWKEPYMPEKELQREINDDVVFWGYEAHAELIGVMGIQQVQDVTLIRHAYVRTSHQNQGVGGRLLSALRQETARPTLVGTWADAVWAVRFYEKHGFQLVPSEEKDRLLREYWSISKRQVDASVVLADKAWFNLADG